MCLRLFMPQSGRPLIAAILVLLSGCISTSRVDETLTTASLARDKKAVAIMRVGSASPTCKHVGVLLGTPEGAGYRRHSVLQVVNVTSLIEPAVAETELTPGTYHLIGYSCHDGQKATPVGQKADFGTYATSYAHFSVQAGEMVNVGFLHFHAQRVGTNAFGRPLRATVSVTDWPLAELDRFKQKRPQIYAQMVTRLMTVPPTGPAPPGEADCARLRQLRSEGKVASLPQPCVPQAEQQAAPRSPS
jgi:hypothetical protein